MDDILTDRRCMTCGHMHGLKFGDKPLLEPDMECSITGLLLHSQLSQRTGYNPRYTGSHCKMWFPKPELVALGSGVLNIPYKCPTCNGECRVWAIGGEASTTIDRPCPTCKGAGFVVCGTGNV